MTSEEYEALIRNCDQAMLACPRGRSGAPCPHCMGIAQGTGYTKFTSAIKCGEMCARLREILAKRSCRSIKASVKSLIRELGEKP